MMNGPIGQPTQMSNTALLWLILLMIIGAIVTGAFIFMHFDNTLNKVLQTTQLNEVRAAVHQDKLMQLDKELDSHEVRILRLEQMAK